LIKINKKSFNGVNFKVRSDKKDEILKDLDALAINDSTLYPELEKQTQYIRQLFSH
jgi:hypothetical protein